MAQGYREKTAEKVLKLVEDFIDGQDITCPETIHQADRVIQSAYKFIEQLCDAAGYAGRAS